MELPNYTTHTHTAVCCWLAHPTPHLAYSSESKLLYFLACARPDRSFISHVKRNEYTPHRIASHHTTHVICMDDWPLKCVATETLLCLWCERVQITRRARVYSSDESRTFCAHTISIFLFTYTISYSSPSAHQLRLVLVVVATFLLWRFIHTRKTTAKRKISWKRWFCSTEKTAT